MNRLTSRWKKREGADRPLFSKTEWMVLLLVGLAHIPLGWALESEPTPPVVGHKPVLAALEVPHTIDPDKQAAGAWTGLAPITFGQEVTAEELGLLKHYHDEDGDLEGGSIIKWYQAGQLVHQGPTFTPQATMPGAFMLEVRVTPKSLSGWPDIGEELSVKDVKIRSKLIERFIRPTKEEVMKNWDDANQNCASKGGRLPTMAELTQLILNEVGQHLYICARYGWPTWNYCGGVNSDVSNIYWTSDQDPSQPENKFAIDTGTITAENSFKQSMTKTTVLSHACIKN